MGRLNQKNRRINGQPGQPLGQPHTEVGQKKGGILGVKMTYLDNLDNLDNLYQRNTPPRLKQGKGTERRRRGGGGLFVGERLGRLGRLAKPAVVGVLSMGECRPRNGERDHTGRRGCVHRPGRPRRRGSIRAQRDRYFPRCYALYRAVKTSYQLCTVVRKRGGVSDDKRIR